jgi:DNA polymerase-1
MELSSLFGNHKPLASTIKTVSNTPALNQRAGVSQNLKPNPIPNRCPFPITWPEVPAQGVKDYQVITTEAELRKYLNRCLETGYCSFDWETAPDDATRQRWAEYEKDLRYRLEAAEFAGDTKLLKAINEEYSGNGKKKKGTKQVFLETPLDPHQADICCFSISALPNESRVIFLSMQKGTRNFEPKMARNDARKLALDILSNIIFRNKACLKIAFNLAFESKFAARYAKYILLPVSDPFVMITRVMQIAKPELIPDPERPQYGMDLKTRTEVLFGVKMSHFKDLLERKGVEFFDELSTDDIDTVVYSAEDSDYGIQHHLYWDQVAKQIPNKNDVYKNYSEWLHGIEMPFSRVIGLMEYNGMAWNHEEAETKRKEAEQKILETQEEIKKLVFDTVGLNVNPGKTGKTKQVREAIFDAMKLHAVAWSEETEEETLDNPAILDMIFLLENNLLSLDEEELLGVSLPDHWEWMNVDKNCVNLPEGTFTPEDIAPVIQAMKKLKVDERKRIRIAQRPPHPYKEAGIKLLKLMQNIQRYSTLLNSHIKGREKFLHPVTGRIHAGYTPWTRTSRLNSSKPERLGLTLVTA